METGNDVITKDCIVTTKEPWKKAKDIGLTRQQKTTKNNNRKERDTKEKDKKARQKK